MPDASVAAAGRAFTPRAVLLALGLALPLAWLTPWNDWYLRNAYLYNHQLPPIATSVLLVLACVVNPLLGRRRLARGELAVVAAVLLAIGGVVSSGFARYWSGVVAGPARTLVREPKAALAHALDAGEQAALAAALRTEYRRDFARLDADGDQRLAPAEVWGGAARVAAADRDGDDALSADEYAEDRAAHDHRARDVSRWALPPAALLAIPQAGTIDPNDAGYQRVIDGYFDGARRGGRVVAGARVTWRGPDGAVHVRDLALSGLERERHPRAGAIDLDDAVGRAVAGQRAGAVVDTIAGRIAILAIEPPPTVPWAAWLAPALAWAPLVVGLIVASVATAFLVRRQWLHHERVPYPVARAMAALIEDPEPGRRLPETLRTRAFRIGAGVAFAIVAWRGLAKLGWVPFTIALEVDLTGPFAGEPWTRMYEYWMQVNPHLYLGMLAMAFLIPLDLSFSLWAFFVAANLIVMGLGLHGRQVSFHQVRQVGFGSFLMLAPLILWLGRRWYLAVLVAATTRRGDEHARAAAPWLWALAAGVALMTGWLVALGAPVGAALATVAVLLAFLLVVARIVAEAGVPFLQLPENVNEVIYATVGFGLPVPALVPLAMIGMCLFDAREAMLPYAVDASYLAERGGVPTRSVAPLMIGVALIAAVIACASMIWHAYAGTGQADTWLPYRFELDKIAVQAQALDPLHAGAVEGARGEDLACYGVGAAVTALCGIGRTFLGWWPLHPLALGVALSYPGAHGWASFLVAWVIKGLVMRYGGVGLYRRLVPAAIGLAAGEAAAVCLFAAVKIVVTGILGVPMPAYVDALPS